ncbi:MAG TPA: HEAT repeat domain-containing protein, partial [Candidatus Limnocylindria bacterium]|nr:HEAT repeat domain-containing protein [Candidatus Limnocylindria bacterium]
VIDTARSSADSTVAAKAATLLEPMQRAQLRRTMLDSGVATILALTAALRSVNALVRAAAAEALQQTADARALPVLREALRDANEEVRRAAALALGTLKWQPGTEEDLAYFLVALGRWKAALTLGSGAVDALLLAATRSNSENQATAINTLAESGSVRALSPLVKLLDSPHAPVRKTAAQGLKTLEWVPVNSRQAITHAVELEDWPGAVSFGADAIAPLMAALKDSHDQPERSGMILCSLIALDDPKAADALVPYCRDGQVAGTAVAALDRLLERTAAEVSAETLHAISQLKNVVQFQFSMDPAYGRLVRKGMELINIDDLRARASAEIARRGELDALVSIASNEGETP